MPASLVNVDCMDIIRIDNSGAAQCTHELCKDVYRNLSPGKVTQCRECDGHSRVDMSARNSTRKPYAESGTCGFERFGG